MFYEKRMGQLVEADSLGEEWKGYVFRISGGNDKQGFPMKQGILTAGRVRLLLSKGHSCYRPRRNGERKRKSVRGCIVDQNLSVLALVVKKKGEQEIEGLTDKTLPRRLGPKRASKIRKLFNLTKQDDVRQYVIRKPVVVKEGKEVKKERTKAPKIQRLITPLMLQHKRRRLALKRARIEKRQEDEAGYARLLAQRAKEEKERRAEAARKRRSTRESQSSAGGEEAAPVAKKAKAAAPKKEKAPVAAVEKKPAAPAKVKKMAPDVPTKKPAVKKAAPTEKKAAAPAEKKAAPAEKKAASGEKKAPSAEKKAAPAKPSEKSKPASAKKGPAKKK